MSSSLRRSRRREEQSKISERIFRRKENKKKAENKKKRNNRNEVISLIPEKLSAQKSASIQNPKATLAKITKHLSNPKKQDKCAKLLVQFLMAQHGMVLDMLGEHQVISALDSLIKLPSASLQNLYEFVLNSYAEEGFKDERNDLLMQIWYIPVYLVPRLRTDDSFDFNSTLKQFKECVTDLCLYSDLNLTTQVVSKIQNSLECVRDASAEGWLYQDVEFDDFVQIALRYYVMRGVEQIYSHRQEKWALSSISLFLKQLYLNKEKFQQPDQERIGDMLTGLKSKSSAISKMNQKRAIEDQKLKSNPLQNYHPIADGRGTSVVVDGLDSWDTKQLGLSGK